MYDRRLTDIAQQVVQATPRRCLVTGATGFIGSALVERLVTLGHSVRVLVRPTSDLKWLSSVRGQIEVLSGQLNIYESILDAATNREWVFHVAGATKARTRDDWFRANRDGAANMFRATIRRSADTLERFVLVSSQAAAGPAPDRDHPTTEDDEPHPISLYGESKLAGERAVMELAGSEARDWPWTIVRPPGVYGPRDTDILEFFRAVRQGLTPLIGLRPRIGWEPSYASLIHAHDLVEAFLSVAVSPAAVGEIFFAANPGSADFETVTHILQKAIGKRLVLPIVVPIRLWKALGWINERLAHLVGNKLPAFTYEKACELAYRYWLCDASKLQERIGWRARIPLEQGFRETYQWYKAQGWLA